MEQVLPGFRVLVVDHDPVSREQVCAVVRACGFAVEAADNWSGALAIVAQHMPDVALVDEAMSATQEDDAVNEARSTLRTSTIQLSSVSGSQLQTYATPLLAKPVGERELYAAVHLVRYRQACERELVRRTESMVQSNLRSVMLTGALAELRQLERELQQTGDLRGFYDALLERLMAVTRADYGACGLFDGRGEVQDFVVRGIAPVVAQQIGAVPQGSGVLRAFYQAGHAVRISDIAAHPESCGFPAHHPPMRSLLGAPIDVDGRICGVLYLADKAGGEPFTEWDETIAQIHAAEASHVLQRNGLVRELLNKQRHLEESNAQLKAAYGRIEQAQAQLVQSEKMASIGQLAAGVAHEINNPVGYISSNIGSLQGYMEELFSLVAAYENSAPSNGTEKPSATAQLSFLRQDIADLIKESQEGVNRVRRIVQDLKDFSHVDDGRWEWSDIHKSLDSTLNVVWNELKYKADVRKEYGAIPAIQCRPSQLNQVFMNLLVNAAHAIPERGTITVRTGTGDDEEIWIEVIDSGTGIKPDHLTKIFDPFFTTKPVGKGTGLGLSVSFGIVQKHNGKIEVASELGKGTCFRVRLPIRHTADDSAATSSVAPNGAATGAN